LALLPLISLGLGDFTHANGKCKLSPHLCTRDATVTIQTEQQSSAQQMGAMKSAREANFGVSSSGPSASKLESGPSPDLTKRRGNHHYEILINRYPDRHCEKKSLEDNEYHDSIGVNLEIDDFHDGVATSKCLMPRDDLAFQSLDFNWVAHVFNSEKMKDFGHCRLYVHSDQDCTDPIYILDWVSGTD
jgi:hypothetical protein